MLRTKGNQFYHCPNDQFILFRYSAVAILHTPSLGGGTASFGGDIRSLGAVSQRVQGHSPLSGGLGGEAPQKLKAFCFTFF